MASLALALFSATLLGCASSGPVHYASMHYVQEAEEHATLGGAFPSQGASSFAYVLDHWKIKYTKADLTDALADAVLGKGLEDDMMSLADSKGLWAFASYSTLEVLQVRVRSGFPVIVGLQDSFQKLNTRRPVVVTEIDILGKDVQYREENGDIVKLAADDFLRQWRPVNFWMLIVGPAEKPDWKLSVSEAVARARFHERRGEMAPARVDYENALAQNPSNPGLCIALANLYRRLGQEAKAEDLYRRAVLADPEDGHAANNLAFVLAGKSETLDEAVELARKAATLEPTNPSTLDTLGYVYLKKGNYIAAAATLERARARAGQLPVDQRNEISLHLARAHFQSGQLDQARSILNELMRSQPACDVPADLRNLVTATATALP